MRVARAGLRRHPAGRTGESRAPVRHHEGGRGAEARGHRRHAVDRRHALHGRRAGRAHRRPADAEVRCAVAGPAGRRQAAVHGRRPADGADRQAEPDLIVGTFSIADKETYRLLSDIAPTTATLDAKQVTPWQDLVDVAGQVLDKEQQAESVVESVESKIDATAEDLPGLKGKTFALAQYIVGDAMYIVADEKDGSSALFQQLGM
ncbi:MAG: ABC transporter substrate-binding protein [Streptosporangiales bacterium]|nr:ABC transporter substrate-binding protein [Streptosporangiales bacterium]